MTPWSTADPAVRPARRVARAHWWTSGDGSHRSGARADSEAPTQALPIVATPTRAASTHPAPPTVPLPIVPTSGPPRSAAPRSAFPSTSATAASLAAPLPAAPNPPAPLPAAPTPDRPRSGRVTVRRLVGAVGLAGLLIVGYSVGRALGRPTSDTASAKLAEWGRDHHLGAVVTFLEQKQLDLHPAKTGGTVAGGFHAGGAGAPAASSPPGSVRSTAPTNRQRAPAHTPAPADLKPFGASQPGEGQWQVLERVRGLPALEYAGLTPDQVHTSYAVSIAWMDPKLLRFELRPGAPSGDPGGTFPGYPPSLAGEVTQRTLAAAFNGGFRLNSSSNESQGGFYLDGRTGRALVAGAASLVTYRNGTVAVGAWGRDVAMSADTVGVRQNLRLLVDHGTLSPTVDRANSPVWGYTLGGTQATWRSGVGVTATGAVVYVDGPVLSTRTLGEVLQRAGAVQAMELDINPEWTHLDYFTHDSAGIVAHKLNDGQQSPPEHYLSTEPSSRDFVAVFARTS